MKKKEDRIHSILTSIDANLKQQASMRRIFVQGLVRGLGTALGATVLVALVTSITIQFFNTADLTMIAEYFFNDAVVD